jgi:small multidrug resistance pump
MSVLATPTLPIGLIALLSAVFYSGAMVAMKVWSQGGNAWLALLIAGTLLAAVVFEIAALRTERLGVVYVVILGMEVVIIGAASYFVFGESFSIRELSGIGLVVAGTALAWA